MREENSQVVEFETRSIALSIEQSSRALTGLPLAHFSRKSRREFL